ncbi:MAG: diaminobutyrate acetyltransferase [Hydrogenovibrio sp.]
MNTQTSNATVTFRKPVLKDGLSIYQLIQASPPLDVNSSYLYFLQASHFADTCVVAEYEGNIAGFISAYYRPDVPGSLFVWQVAVSDSLRGQGMAKRLLSALIQQQPPESIRQLCCTIGPSNQASQGLFKSFAKQHGLTLQVEPFITEADFGDLGHEAEELYRLQPESGDCIRLVS